MLPSHSAATLKFRSDHAAEGGQYRVERNDHAFPPNLRVQTPTTLHLSDAMLNHNGMWAHVLLRFVGFISS
jgi:hypothetical protein